MILVLFLVALVLAPAASATLTTSSAANSKYAVGLNVGTNTGIGFQYRMNREFDIIGNLGLQNFGLKYLSFDFAANYKVAEFSIEKADFDVTVGVGPNVGIPIDGTSKVTLAVLAPVGIVYSIDKDTIPLDLYLRVAPGLSILPEIGFGFSGYIGALWRFN